MSYGGSKPFLQAIAVLQSV